VTELQQLWSVVDGHLDEGTESVAFGTVRKDFEKKFDELFGLRPEVLTFAKLMEKRLRKHDTQGVRSWLGVPPDLLYEEMAEKCSTLWRVSRGWQSPPAGMTKAEAVAKEAADVACFAMMIADVVGGLK
jgi:hypothetical protein